MSCVGLGAVQEERPLPACPARSISRSPVVSAGRNFILWPFTGSTPAAGAQGIWSDRAGHRAALIMPWFSWTYFPGSVLRVAPGSHLQCRSLSQETRSLRYHQLFQTNAFGLWPEIPGRKQLARENFQRPIFFLHVSGFIAAIFDQPFGLYRPGPSPSDASARILEAWSKAAQCPPPAASTPNITSHMGCCQATCCLRPFENPATWIKSDNHFLRHGTVVIAEHGRSP